MEPLNASALIARARSESGLTQSEFAKRAGTSQPAVARYEAGIASPSAATLTRLLKAGGYELVVELKRTSISNLSSTRARKVRDHRGEIKKFAKAAGISNVRLFGSVARGADNENSDIDFLVDFIPGELGGLPIIEFKEKVEKLLNEKIDVAPSDLLKASVLEKALQEAIPL